MPIWREGVMTGAPMADAEGVWGKEGEMGTEVGVRAPVERGAGGRGWVPACSIAMMSASEGRGDARGESEARQEGDAVGFQDGPGDGAEKRALEGPARGLSAVRGRGAAAASVAMMERRSRGELQHENAGQLDEFRDERRERTWEAPQIGRASCRERVS